MASEESELIKLPKRHLSEIEQQYIMLSIERAKLRREQTMIILNKGLLLFFAFLVFAVILYMNYLINQTLFNLLVVAGIIVLGIAIVPYMNAVKEEEKKIESLISSLTK
ncbi:MAG: hypothetical protein QXK37_02375 [Candidatus Woesearchaeota archaeon]